MRNRIILALRRGVLLTLLWVLGLAAVPGAALAYGSAPVVEYYVVQPGDTLSQIAERYGTSLIELERLNHLWNPGRIYVGQRIRVPAGISAGGTLNGASDVSGSYGTYVVKPGDTLYLIAVRFHTTIPRIMKLNSLRSTLIFVGQRLKVPVSTGSSGSSESHQYGVYGVQPGDTLYSIAVRFHVSLSELKQLNPWLVYRTWLLPGDKLKVPYVGGIPAGSSVGPTPVLPKPPAYWP